MGKPRIAFVGSGGATKGLAHLGVLMAMEELDLRPDIFVGASTGAIVGAFVSQGLGSEEMIDWFRPFWRRRDAKPLKARHFLGLPNGEQLRQPGYLTSGVFSMDRVERFLASRLPCNDFRMLERPLFVTAADIDGRGRAVFGRGYREDVPISQALAASSCIPVLFRPYRIGDRYYVDGELVRTLSADLAVGAGAEIIIVSNVYHPTVTRPPRRSIARKGAVQVGRQAFDILLNEKSRRSMELMQRLHPHVTLLDVAPSLGRYSFTSRRHAERIVQLGYREGFSVLAAAKRRGLFEVAANVRTVGEA